MVAESQAAEENGAEWAEELFYSFLPPVPDSAWKSYTVTTDEPLELTTLDTGPYVIEGMSHRASIPEGLPPWANTNLFYFNVDKGELSAVRIPVP